MRTESGTTNPSLSSADAKRRGFADGGTIPYRSARPSARGVGGKLAAFAPRQISLKLQ
jgi:hypothetical protein